MRNDFRALCAELTEFVARLTKHYYEPAELLTRAALADEPAVLDGREPASVTGQPSDEAIIAFARDVLELWGNRQGSLDSSAPQPPVEGEVAELVRLLGSMAAEAELADQVHDASVLDRAADLLQRLSQPQPVPVSERLPGPTHWLPAHALLIPHQQENAND